MLNEDHATIAWQITGTVTRVDILSCDADGHISPCVNTTETNPENGFPVIVDIPPGPARYRFDLYLYDNGDLVQQYEDEEWLVVEDDPSITVLPYFPKQNVSMVTHCTYNIYKLHKKLRMFNIFNFLV